MAEKISEVEHEWIEIIQGKEQRKNGITKIEECVREMYNAIKSTNMSITQYTPQVHE